MNRSPLSYLYQNALRGNHDSRLCNINISCPKGYVSMPPTHFQRTLSQLILRTKNEGKQRVWSDRDLQQHADPSCKNAPCWVPARRDRRTLWMVAMSKTHSISRLCDIVLTEQRASTSLLLRFSPWLLPRCPGIQAQRLH